MGGGESNINVYVPHGTLSWQCNEGDFGNYSEFKNKLL